MSHPVGQKGSEVDDMTHGYLACALWTAISDIDSTPAPMDSLYDLSDLSQTAINDALTDCTAHLEAVHAIFHASPVNRSQTIWADMSSIGHDFSLTRNGHGTGYWDRYYSELSVTEQQYVRLGEELTENAKGYRETDLYVGDDGLLYFS